MKFMTRLAVLFYLTIIILLVVSMCAFVLQLIDLEYVVAVLEVTYWDVQIRALIGLSGLVLLLVSLMFARSIYSEYQKGKTIAFDNPAGRVSVSLLAMEDLVRRAIMKIEEVREVKAGIVASKKGLEVNARLILRSDVHIPEMTANLQELVRKKIQSTIGLEEAVTVRIHVTKIIPSEARAKKSKPKEKGDDENIKPNVPFQGYRA